MAYLAKTLAFEFQKFQIRHPQFQIRRQPCIPAMLLSENGRVQFTGCFFFKLQMSNYKLQITSYELRVTNQIQNQ